MREVIVVGGGPAGTSCATAIAKAGLSVELWTEPRRTSFAWPTNANSLATARKAGVAVRKKRVEDANRLSAHWIVDATGRRASIARAFGAERKRRDRLVALLWRERQSEHGKFGAEIEPVSYGCWRTTRLEGDRQMLALFTDADLLPAADQRQDAKLVDASTSYLDRIVEDGWLAVGDAAVAIDPLVTAGGHDATTMGRAAAQAIVSGNFSAYLDGYRDLMRRCLQAQGAFYGGEQRWPDAAFWARRLTQSETLAA